MALQTFVREHVEPGATLYTDEAAAYRGMPEFEHEAVNHSTKEFVRGMASTNGMESFWSMLKRGYQGTFHHFSESILIAMSLNLLAVTMFAKPIRSSKWASLPPGLSASGCATRT